MTASALYRGDVMHRRWRPKPHRLRYRVFWLLLDLAELDDLDKRLRLFSRGRWNVLSFRDRARTQLRGGETLVARQGKWIIVRVDGD